MCFQTVGFLHDTTTQMTALLTVNYVKTSQILRQSPNQVSNFRLALHIEGNIRKT
jgi:hypothetical protein